MGLDFVRHNAASFTKRWDRGRIELCQRSIFTKDPEMAARTALARTHGTISADSSMLVRVEGKGLAGYRGLTRVASFVAPPPDLVEAVRETGGCAAGTVVAVHDGSVAEIALC